jgi:hypothetical protein
MQVLNASSSGEIDAACAAMSRERAEALFVVPDSPRLLSVTRCQRSTKSASSSPPAA